jgi:hypothetical protein
MAGCHAKDVAHWELGFTNIARNMVQIDHFLRKLTKNKGEKSVVCPNKILPIIQHCQMVANGRSVWVYTHYMHGTFGEIFKASTHQKRSVTYIKWPHMVANVNYRCHGQMLVDG